MLASPSLLLAQKLLLIHLRINARRTGRWASAPLRRKLTRIVAPCILHVLVPLLWDQHEPLLACGLIIFRVGLPRPEQRASRQNLLRAGATLVVDAIGDAPSRLTSSIASSHDRASGASTHSVL